MGSQNVCAKCGVTLDERVRWWLTPEKGVVKIGPVRGMAVLSGLFLYCENCRKTICGGCSIDLAVNAGCPYCARPAKELSQQEILTLLGREKVAVLVREGLLKFVDGRRKWWQFWK